VGWLHASACLSALYIIVLRRRIQNGRITTGVSCQKGSGRVQPTLGSAQRLKSRRAFHIRLSAGFPAIARFRTEFPDWEFTADELYERFGWNRLKDSPYRTYIEMLVESGAKIPELTAILADAAKRWSADVQDGKPKAKAIVLTHSPAILAILIIFKQLYL
jgi:hypothetical protein